MADGQMNIRVNVDLNDMRRKAEEYRREVTKMGLVTDKSGNVISTAWQRVSEAEKKSNIGRIAEEMTGDVSANIEIQKKVLKDLEGQYKSVSKAVENTAPGIAKSKLQQELSSIKKEIDGEKKALQELEKVQQQYRQSNLTLRTQIYQVRNEMGRLRMQGQTNTEQYRQLEAELGRLGTAYRQLQYEQKALSTGTTQWGGIISGIQGLTGAFSAAQGVIGLFVTDNEKLAKIQTRLQAVMAITIGMQQVSNTLHETSAFRMTTVRRVTELFTGAQKKLAAALGISTLKAQVLMGTLTLGLSAAITGIIYLISKWTSVQRKAAEEQKHITEVTNKALESVGEQTAVYEKLRKQWNALADNMDAKKKFIEENKDEFDKLGIAINGVDDAENLLIRNKDAFLKSLNERAMAAASYELAVEKYQEVLKKQAELEKTPKTVTRTKVITDAETGMQVYSYTYEEENKEYTRLEKEIEKAKEAADSFISKQIESVKNAKDIIANAGLTDIQIDKLKKEAAKAQKEKEEKERKAVEARKKVLEKINEELLAFERKNQQSRIDLMKEGTEKELAQIRKDYKDKIAEIKKQADKWAEEQGGTLTVQQTKDISLAYSYADKKREQDESDVYKKQTDELNELLKQYQSYQQQRLDIERKYNKDIEKLQEELAKTTEESERNRLEESIRVAKEKKKTELSGLDLEQFQKEIDWSSVFGNLDKLSTDALKKLRDKIKEYLSTVDDSISKEDFKTVVDAFENLDATITNREPLEELVSGYRDYRKAVEEVTKAKKEMDKADNPEAKERAVKNLSAAEKKRAESLSKITQSVNAIGQQGQQVISAGNDLVNMLTNLGIEIPESISGALSGLGQVVDGLAEIDITKPMSAVTGVIHTLAGVTKTIGSIFGVGSDNGVAQYKALREQLEAINDLYKKIIDKSKEKIVFGGGFASVEAAKEANEALEKQIENYRRLAEVGGKAGSSAGSHSYAYRANERLKKSWNDISKSIGQNISSVQQMYKLSGEQLEIIRRDFPEAWSKIPSEITENLDAIIDCNDEAKELANTLQEALTGISFDSFYNGFIDSLSDMDASFEDMCDDFEGYLRKSIIAGLIASQYKGRIENLYKSWTEAAESENKITEREAKKLRDDYQDIIQDMIKDRDNLAKTFNWEGSPEELKRQTGTISETITEKTANESMGIWRGSYDTLKAISQQTTIFHETYKSTMATCNSILNTIARNTGETANNTSVLSDMHNTLKNMDGRLRTIESESSKRYAR